MCNGMDEGSDSMSSGDDSTDEQENNVGECLPEEVK